MNKRNVFNEVAEGFEALAEERMLWLKEAVAQGIITPASAKKIIENKEYQEVQYPIVSELLKEKE